LNSNSNWKN